MNYYQRVAIIYNAGFTIHDINAVTKEMNSIKRQRTASATLLPIHKLQYNIKNIVSRISTTSASSTSYKKDKKNVKEEQIKSKNKDKKITN